ncbi:MAG: class I lanthipeptide [Acidobacteriota bacterium]|nr:class I lanthipeptide [Acidobacteriota bacterium]
MKKKVSRLSLHRETLRRLSDLHLHQAAGGILQRPTQTCGCDTDELTCTCSQKTHPC